MRNKFIVITMLCLGIVLGSAAITEAFNRYFDGQNTYIEVNCILPVQAKNWIEQQNGIQEVRDINGKTQAVFTGNIASGQIATIDLAADIIEQKYCYNIPVIATGSLVGINSIPERCTVATNGVRVGWRTVLSGSTYIQQSTANEVLCTP